MKEKRSTPHERVGGPAERDSCLRVASRYLPPADAEDVVQEALLKAWCKEDAWVPATGPLALLVTITRHEAINVLRRRKREAVKDDLEEGGAEDLELAALPSRLDLARAVSGLSDDERRLLELRYYDGLTQHAIATRLGIPPNTVATRLSRTRARLRRFLENDEGW